MGELILPAKATVLKHRPWSRNGASAVEEQLQAYGGLCWSWKDFGIYQVRQGLEVFCKKDLAWPSSSQLSRIAILLRVLGNFF